MVPLFETSFSSTPDTLILNLVIMFDNLRIHYNNCTHISVIKKILHEENFLPDERFENKL